MHLLASRSLGVALACIPIPWESVFRILSPVSCILSSTHPPYPALFAVCALASCVLLPFCLWCKFVLIRGSLFSRCLRGYKSIMQNKPNFQNPQTNTTAYATKTYANIPLRPKQKNKPKQTQFIATNTASRIEAGTLGGSVEYQASSIQNPPFYPACQEIMTSLLKPNPDHAFNTLSHNHIRKLRPRLFILSGVRLPLKPRLSQRLDYLPSLVRQALAFEDGHILVVFDRVTQGFEPQARHDRLAG